MVSLIDFDDNDSSFILAELTYIEGDKVIIKDIKKIKECFRGKIGIVRKWHTTIPSSYSVYIEDMNKEIYVFEDEITKVC